MSTAKTISSNEEIAAAGRRIRAGEMVAFPTETVYGLGANALDAAAVQRIYQAKGRPTTSPLIVHVDSVEMARELARVWPDAAARLTAAFWPGPLTLVLPKQPHVPDMVTAGLDTVGLRMPAHPMALALIRLAGVPVAAPSANRFTQLSPTTAEHVRSAFPELLVLDGGPTDVGLESTVVSLVSNPTTLLRPGMVTQAQLEAVVGPLCIPGPVSEMEAHPAPGMHTRHYSPRTPLLLISGPESVPPGRGVYLAAGVSMPMSPAEYAAVLYAKLHELDQQHLDWIAVETPPETPEWEAIRDRLERASTNASVLGAVPREHAH